ncbi:hemagglutinin repeat-containing protein [Mitsuaria sp. 7]|uniref:hemagglutinin repeat-containing protein n=1 Tax=Mitsuaria sp. 7 TaxID=1658665 RepID=UPI0007DD9961|nr:hemagglutinin repeat-containing protein [Mitsuaria sp. 7]ANH68317.1 hypothetical protein ABE85_13420 [Mitsuaria sp. 7]
MNRLQYRIVFNKQRGQMMAVAETALSHVKGGSAGESQGPAARALSAAEVLPAVSRGPPALLALAAAFAMGAAITLAPDALAQVKADPNAPKGQQPTVVNSANGTVQVNIQTPSAAGVSRNSYSQFDVDKRGVILNNSRTDVSTQLGGFVQGNPWLAKGGARVILNEVNSSAPSQLKGYVEVAGQRAEVVIANPSGIQVDGAGFINASAAVLTTGTPRFNADGSIAGYGVQGGLIRVDGQGLDGASTDYTALLARAVEINAGIWAKDARIQTGTQLMTVDENGVAGGESLAPTGERPRYALDSTALGGIYAQRIRLVGTEAGLGVRQAGQVVGGQLTLRADGWLDNSGTVYAQEADVNGAPSLTVQSNAGVRNAGWMASRGSADVRAPQLAGEAGSVTAAGLAADGAIVAGGGSLALTATQSAKQAGQLLAADRLTVQAPTINLGGAQAQAGSIALGGDTVAAREALLIAGNGIEVTGTASVDLTRAQAQAGTIAATAPTLTADGAQLSADGTLSLKADGTLSTQAASLAGKTLSVAAHDIDLRKSEWLSLGTDVLSVRVLGAIVADDARIATNGTDLLIAADTVSAQRARVEHYGSGVLSMSTGSLGLASAQVLSNGVFRIDAIAATLDRAEVSAPTIQWHATELSHRGAHTRVASAADSSVDVDGRLDNTGGVLQTNSDTLALRAAVLENNDGVLSTSGRVLRVETGSLGNRSGVMQSAGTLEAGAGQRIVAIDNTGGQIVADVLSLNAQQLVNAGGVVAASGRAALQAGEWDNGSGRIEAGTLALNADRLRGAGSVYARGDATIAATRLETTGVLAAGGTLSVRADQVSTTGLLAAGLRVDGTVGNAGDLSIDATGTLRHGGTLLAGGALTATAESLALQDSASQAASVAMTARQGGMTLDRATVSTSGSLALDGAGQLSTEGARIAGAQVAIKADAWRNAGGEVLQTGAAGAMTLQVAGHLDNAGGQIGANGVSLAITAGSFDNTAGRVAQAGDALTLSAGRIDGARGELLARGALQVRASGDADLTDALTQARAIDLQAGHLTHRGGEMAASEGLVVAARAIDNAAGALQAGGALSLSGDAVTNLDGEISGRTVAVDAGTLTNAGRGLITGADRLTVRANTLDNIGHLQSQGGMSLNVLDTFANSGTVQGRGDLALNVGRLIQQSTGTIAAQGHLSVDATSIDSSGTFAAGLLGNGGSAASGDLALRTTGALRQGGSLFAAGALSASGGTLDLGGSRSQAASMAFTATRGDLSLNGAQAAAADALSISTSDALLTTGATLSGHDVTIAARQWNNTGGVLAQTGGTGALQATVAEGLLNAQGVISAQGRAMSLQAGRLDNANGRLVQAGGGDLVLRGDRVDGASGQVLTDGRLTIESTGAIDLNGATTQASALTLTGASLDHRNGHLLVQGDAALTVTGALQNQGGQISATGALSAAAATMANAAGQLDGQRVTLTATTLDNGAQGLIAARGDLTVNADHWTNGGSAQAQGRADLTVTGTLANAGTIHAQGDAALTVGALTQTASAIVAAQGGLTIAAGSIASAGTLAAGLKGDNTLAAAGDLRLTVDGTLQQSGHLLTAGALSATAAHLDLDDSQAQAKAATLIATDGAGTIGLDRAVWSVRGALSLNAAGAVVSDHASVEAGAIDLTAGRWSNLAGRWLQTDATGAFTATVSGLLDNRQGELGMNGASTTLAADRVDNGAGRIAQAGGALDFRVRQFDGAQGQVLATGALTLNASGALTLDGATTQGASVRVDAGSLSHVNGRLLSAGNAVLRVGGELDNRGGLMQAASTLDIASAGMNNTAGQLSGQTVALRADRLDNGAQGVIGAGGVLTIDAGRLTNAGTVQGVGDTTLTVTGLLDNSGMVYSQGRVTVQADELRNPGTIAAQGSLSASTGQLSGNGVFAAGLRPDNTWSTVGDLSLSATRSLQFGGAATAAGDLGVTAPSLQLQGAQLQAATMALRATAGDLSLDHAAVAAAQRLEMAATARLVTSAAQVSAGDVRLTAGDWLNAGGRLTQTSSAGTLQAVLGGNLDNHGGTIESAGAQLTLAAGTVDNGAGRIAQAGGNLTLRAAQWDGAQGQVLTSGALDWQVTGALTATGATTQADSLRLVAGSLAHDGGRMTAAQAATLDVDGTLGNRGGSIVAGTGLSVEAGRLSNAAGGLMQAGGALQVGVTGADALDNQGGRLRSGGDMTITAAALDNRGGWAGSDGQLTVRAPGALLNQQGTLLAQRAISLEGGSLSNQGGRIASVQGAIGVTTSGLLDNAQGSVLAAGGLTLTSTGLGNQGGELSGSTVTVDARGQSLDNRGGRVLASDAMTVRSGALDNHGGLLQSLGALSVDTAGAALTNTFDAAVTTVTGLRAQGALRVDAGSVDNGAGMAGNAVTINAASLVNRNAISGQTVNLGITGTLDNRGGQVMGAQTTTATVGQVLNQSGLIFGGQTLDLRAGGLIDNRDTSGANLGLQGGAVTLRAATIDNRNGQLRADGDLRATASQRLDNGGGVLSALGQAVIGDGGADPRASALDLRNGSGKVWGATGVTVAAAGLSGGGEISSGAGLSLTLGGDLTNGAGTLLQSRGDMALTLGGNFTNQGVLRAGGALSVAASNIDNQATGELSSADTRLTASGTLTNRGLIDGDRVRIEADQVLNVGSGRIYGSDLTIAGGQLVNGAENGQSAVIASRGALTVAMTGAVSNTTQSLIYADGDLSLRAASLLNENATIEASRLLQLDVSGGIANRSIHDGANALPQDPAAPRVLDSKAFISSGGDMRITAGQVINSGATIEARGNLLLQSADIQNLNPYLKWQLVNGQSTTGWEFQAPGSTVRYKPEEIRVLWAVGFDAGAWGSEWGSPAQGSLEPFVWEFHPKQSTWSQDTYNRKMLLPSVRYPNEVFGRYLGGLGGDADGSANRGFQVRASGDHMYQVCTIDGCTDELAVGAHYAAGDRIWSDFGVTPGDDAGLDAALGAFYADANSRLRGDFTAFNYTRTTQSAAVTQSSAGQIIVGGTLRVEGGKIVNEMSRVIGRTGVDIQSTDIDNRTIRVNVTGTEQVDVYRTWNDGSSVPNTGIGYTTTNSAINDQVDLKLPALGGGAVGADPTLAGRQQAGAVGGAGGAQTQQASVTTLLGAGSAGSTGALNASTLQSIVGGGDASAGRATAAWRSGGQQQAVAVDAQDASNGAVAADLRVRHAAETGAQIVRGADGAVVRTDAQALGVSAQDIRLVALQPSSGGAGVSGPGRITTGGLGAAQVVPGKDANGRLRAVPASLALPGNSLFKLRTDTRTGYLIETDPRFANYRDWLSSDFLLQAMSVDPATAQKRLGDGFYEQRLVREQIGQLTGSTFLQGYASDEEMYRALMANGASFGQSHQLRPGVALTAEQMSLLTTDLVWLVEQQVTLADGSTQRVLVPQVYLLPRDGDLQGTGALIAGDRVNLALSGTLDNSGDLRATGGLSATAQNIVNSGSMRGASVALSAKEDLRNIGGELTATDTLSLSAGRDLVVASTTASGTTDTSQRTVLSRVASLNAGGVMVLQAGQDVVLDAAQLRQTGGADGGILVDAGRDLKLGAVKTASSDRATFDANNHLYQGSSQDVRTSIQSKGPVLLNAGQDLVAKGAAVSSDGAVQLTAGRDIQLLAAQATESLDEASKHTVKGFLKSTTTSSQTQIERTMALGTTISGQTVSAQAGQDLLLKGSNLVSDEGTTLHALRDVKIENALDTSKQYDDRQQVTKGLLSGGIGFTIGTRDQRSGNQKDSETVVGSTVGSVNGDVTIVAGRKFSQVGSVIQTPKGDVDVTAQKISIQSAAQEGKDVQTTAFRQSGLSVSVSAPVLSALQGTMDMADNIGKVGDARMQALGAASTAIKAKEAAQAMQADPQAGGGLSISITVGSTQSKSRTETTTTTQQGSEITAGGDIRLTAQGAGKDSSISVQGSDLAAAQRLALKADGDVSLTSSQDLIKQKSENSSSSAAVGVAISVGSGGASMGFTASASIARGKSDGEDVIQRNTHVQGQQVSIESGGDTTLKGAVVSGDKVTAKVGGDLNIESLQDTSRFRSESMQAGGSVTVGAGFSGSASFGQSKVKSDFASVTEQSGIRAGDGGFQVEVKGNTDLKGGSITSTQAAIDAGANAFKSGSLTLSDIENKADYKGSSFSVSAGFGKKDGSDKNEGGEKPKDGSYQLMTMKPGDPGQSAGMGYTSDSAGSTTKAGISGVAGNTAARTGDAESGIKQIFDKEKVQQDLAAQVAITQTFGKEASKQIGEFADKQLIKAADLRAQAHVAVDEREEKQLIAQAESFEKQWGPEGTLRVAAHAVVGGLTGNLDGAIGAVTGTLTAPQVKDVLERAGLDDNLARGLTALASTAVGGMAGGSAGVGAAFNEVTNNYLSHLQVGKMLEELRNAKNRNEREKVFKEYAELSQRQSAEIANCRDKACDDISRDIAKGQKALQDNAREIGEFAGWFNDKKQDILNTQIGDKFRLQNQVEFNVAAKKRVETYSNMNLSPNVLKAIEYGTACTSSACVQTQYDALRSLKGKVTGNDAVAIQLEIGFLYGRMQAFGECLKNTGCSGIALAGGVAMGLKATGGTSTNAAAPSGNKAAGSGGAMEDLPEGYYQAKVPSKSADKSESVAACATGTECFVAGTPVWTPEGPKSIETLRIGDAVVSRDEKSGAVSVRRVVATKATPDQTVYAIRVMSNNVIEEIVATGEHPFWVTNKEGGAGWIQASDLTSSALLTDIHGGTASVFEVEKLKSRAAVFNIEVEEFHTYHVGQLAIWVHNAKCCEVNAKNPLNGLRLSEDLKMEQKQDPRIGTTLPGAKAPITVTADAYVDGISLFDTNQMARPSKSASSSKPTLIADLIAPGNPNSNMANAHAEIGVIQQAYDANMTQGRTMTIVVRGEPVCTFCMTTDNIATAAQRAGLARLELVDTIAGKTYIWTRSDKGVNALVEKKK